jgi:exopolyphosphatase / guanosine-5'-triphosphate,3'-diphosphate pyrophosphatase
VLPAAYAAVDLGTNNCRMLVARPSGRGFRVVDSFSRIVRLGEGLASSGRLTEAAVERTVDALKVCAGKMRNHSVTRVRNVATEACRRAENCQVLLDRVEAETGLVLEPIPAMEEARLTLAGCASLLDGRWPFGLVFDIGGGSTEATWVAQSNTAPPRVLGVLSLPFGVVDLAEEYGCETVEPDQYARLVDGVDADLAAFDDEFGIAREIARGRVQMLGTSGTVTTLGALYLNLPRYDRARVDGLDMDFDGVASISATLSAMDRETRAANNCIGRARADLVVMGCAVLDAICRRWPVGRVRVADRGIREGVLMGLMAADGTRPAVLPVDA